MPGGDGVKRILPGDEKQFEIRVGGLLEMSHGVDGVGFSRPRIFHVRNRKRIVSGNGQLQHPQAVFKGDDSAVFLVRRRRGGNEDDAVQLQNLRELLGGPQVSEMDRVECSAKEPELHERTCPSP